MAENVYRTDSRGRKVHKSLDDLAVKITKRAAENGGKFEPFPLPIHEYQRLERENAIFHSGTDSGGSVGDGTFDRINFIWRGVPVYPESS